MNCDVWLKRFFLIILFPFLIYSCSSSTRKSGSKLLSQDSSIYTREDYSKIHIDSTIISGVVLQDRSLDSFYSSIMDFYRRRNFQAAWFTDSGFGTPAHIFVSRLANYIYLYGDSNVMGGRLIISGDSALLNPVFNFNNTRPQPLIDVLLTAAFFKYANREYYGTNKSAHDLEWFIPRKKKDYLLLLNTLITAGNSYAVQEPVSWYYTELKKQLIFYKKLEEAGGLPFIPYDSVVLKKGDSNTTISTLKKYLRITLDLSTNDSSLIFTDALELSLKNFQERVGIPNHGKLDYATCNELNTSLRERMLQIMINLERMRWAPDSLPQNYLMVNIPDFKLLAIENGRPAWSMRAIVGNAANNTSIFSSNLKTVVFRPYWKVPQSIIVRELLPVLKNDPGYIYRHDMEVRSGSTVVDPYAVNWWDFKKSVPFDIFQRPGKNNSLGLILFQFPNSFDIYMHDTPAKGLFDFNDRAMSHGCIRLAEAEKLAKYIFRNDKNITEAKIHQWMESGNENYVSVNPPLPVLISYFTSWVDGKGRLNFRKDIYGLDKKLEREIFAY